MIRRPLMLKTEVLWKWRQLIIYSFLPIIAQYMRLSSFLNTCGVIGWFLSLYWSHLSIILFCIQSIAKWIHSELLHLVVRDMYHLRINISTVLFSLLDWSQVSSIIGVSVRRLLPFVMMLFLNTIYFMNWKFIVVRFHLFVCDFH